METSAFWDSSALTPLCLYEKTTPRARALARQYAPVVWWGSFVEVHSAISRLHRSGEITDRSLRAARQRLSQLRANWVEIDPTGAVRQDAVRLVGMYPHRAADSFQLAAALQWCRHQPARRAFICADIRLSDAASQAGFTVVTL